MKQLTVLLLTAAVLLGAGCDNTIQKKYTASLNTYDENPITVSVSGNSNDGIQSYKATVQIYRTNSRKDPAAVQEETYSIAVKTIDGKIHTRIDFAADDDLPARAILSNGEEAIIMNPVNNTIEQRVPVEQYDNPFLRLLGSETIIGRINLKQIRTEAMRLAMDITENEAGHVVLDIPPDMFPILPEETVTRRRVSFNPINDTIVNVEVITVLEDGTVRTTKNTPVYIDKDGEPIRVGSVTVIDSKAPGRIENIPGDYPIYHSPEDIPAISDEQFAKMEAEGSIYAIPEMTFGDPADLSYTETVIELYNDLELNNVPNRVFKTILK
ncbi:MAG: hypothetical protein LBD48_07095 [Treponema sp.]|nr:hypothetical protein [Treponema sp.]